MENKVSIDLRGLQCPTPLVQLNEEMSDIETGDEFFAVADDEAFELDIAAWCEMTGNELLAINHTDQEITAHIRKS